MSRIALLVTFFTLLLVFFQPVSAQEPEPEGLVYIVQEGDNLWSIAVRFGVSLDELKTINGIGSNDAIVAGNRLLIPGFEGLGLSGVLNTVSVGFGENLQSLSHRTGVPVDWLARLNRLVSPSELYVGKSVVVVESEEGRVSGARPMLIAGASLLELAIERQVNPWSLVVNNQQTDPAFLLPGEVLWLPQDENVEGPGALPDSVRSLEVLPVPAVQGQTTQVLISGEAGMTFSGDFTGHNLNFFPMGDENYVALQGIHAMQEPGFYPLTIEGKTANGGKFSYTQSVYVKDGQYLIDPVLTVSPETIDPAVTLPEDAQWQALTTPVTPQKKWQGKFQVPVPVEFAECYPSRFGSRRSYNGSSYDYFHTGLDFCGNTSTEIFAPAAGTVVFAGPLTVRGNATIIDHGWGVYTGYLHQSEIFVKTGDQVEAGQPIGLVGATGRVTGPHLHLEVWVGGAQVDPMDWLEQAFPLIDE